MKLNQTLQSLPSIACKLEVLARWCNTSCPITSECNVSNRLPNRQAPPLFTEFADGSAHLISVARHNYLPSHSKMDFLMALDSFKSFYINKFADHMHMR